MTECLYQRHDDVFSPTPVAGSPWHPALLHGGAVSALFGLVVDEQAAKWPDFIVNRLTMSLLRPVPMQALQVRGRVVGYACCKWRSRPMAGWLAVPKR